MAVSNRGKENRERRGREKERGRGKEEVRGKGTEGKKERRHRGSEGETKEGERARLTPSFIEQIRRNQTEEREGEKKGGICGARRVAGEEEGREGQAQGAGSAPPL